MGLYSGLPNVNKTFPANRPTTFQGLRNLFLTSFYKWKTIQLDTSGTYEDTTTAKTFMTNRKIVEKLKR